MHHYIWVPEPYKAKYLDFRPKGGVPDDEELLFRCITEFHKKAYLK